MSDFWSTMFKALEQTSAEEWETFVDNFDASNQAFKADVAMNERLITVTFPQPVVSGTLLAISMDNVRVAGRSNGWLYPVSAKLVGLSSYIPVGFARFSIGY